MKFKKKYLLFLIIPIVLASAVLLLFSNLIPTGRIQKAIISDIESSIKGSVEIKGLTLKILPRPVLNGNGLGIKKDGKEIISIDNFTINPSIIGLLSNRIEGELKISGLRLNYYPPKPPSPPDIPINVPSIEYQEEKKEGFLFSIINEAMAQDKNQNGLSYQVTALHIDSADVNILDEDGKQILQFLQVSLEIPSLLLNSSLFDINLSGMIGDPIKQTIQMTGKISISEGLKSLRAAGINLKIDGEEINIAGEFPLLDNSIPSTINITSQSLDSQKTIFYFPSLAPLIKNLLNISGSYQANISLADKGGWWDISGEINAKNLLINAGKFLSKVFDFPLNIRFVTKLYPTYLSIDDIEIKGTTSSFHLIGSTMRQPMWPSQLSISGSNFLAEELATISPLAKITASLTSPNIFLNFQGNLLDDNTEILGTLKAESAVLFGSEVKGMESSFSITKDKLNIDTLKGSLMDGTISGNGKLEFKESIEADMQIILSLFKPDALNSLPKFITGDPYLVTSLKATAPDIERLKDQFLFSGTFIVPSGNFSSPAISGLLGADTFEKISAIVELPILPPKTKIDDDFKNLLASYQLESGSIKIPMISFSNPNYKARCDAVIYSDGSIGGNGEIYLSEGMTKSIIPDPNMRTKVLATNKRLVIPFLIAKDINETIFMLDEERLASILTGKEAYALPEDSTSQIISTLKEQVKKVPEPKETEKPQAEKPEVEKPKVQKPQVKKPQSPKAGKKTKKAPQEKPVPKDDIDDILKIIIKN